MIESRSWYIFVTWRFYVVFPAYCLMPSGGRGLLIGKVASDLKRDVAIALLLLYRIETSFNTQKGYCFRPRVSKIDLPQPSSRANRFESPICVFTSFKGYVRIVVLEKETSHMLWMRVRELIRIQNPHQHVNPRRYFFLCNGCFKRISNLYVFVEHCCRISYLLVIRTVRTPGFHCF